MRRSERAALGLILMNTALLALKASDPDGIFDIVMSAVSWLVQAALGAYLFFPAICGKRGTNE